MNAEIGVAMASHDHSSVTALLDRYDSLDLLNVLATSICPLPLDLDRSMNRSSVHD